MTLGQLDIFDALADHVAQQILADGLPKLFTSAVRGLPARVAEFEEWTTRWGATRAASVSHAFLPGTGAPSTRTANCQPTTMRARLHCDHARGCHCVGATQFIAVCRGCDWESAARFVDQPAAVLAAHDHAFPGWRHAPVIDADRPGDRAGMLRWEEHVRERYGERPDGFPVITQRRSRGTRCVPVFSPWRGFDIPCVHLEERGR